MTTLTITALTVYTKKDKTFVVELSDNDLRTLDPSEPVQLTNPRTGNSKIFKYIKTDKSDSGEDVAGWWFKNAEEGYKLLVIND